MAASTSPGPRSLSAAQEALLEQRLRGTAGRTIQGIRRRESAGPAPLSPVQHGMWVVDHFLPDNALYSVHRTMWLRGALDLTALRRAVDEVVRRHEILRTTYPDPANPVQQVGAECRADWSLVDLRGLPAEDRREDALRLATEEVSRPFDLRHGPLLRARVYQTSATEVLLLLNMHHIVSDAWSCTLLAHEVSGLYSGYASGRPADVPELPLQYADYASWQADRMSGRLLDGQLAYWRAALDGVAPVLRMPTDRPHPLRPSYRGGQVTRSLSAETTERLRAFVAAQGTTVFSTVLAAFAVVLHRSSGQERFAVGSLTSGRQWMETEPLLGLFANTVAIPVDLGGNPSFTDLLARTTRAVVGALDHQDVSFEQVVAHLQPPRDNARNPLFQVLFQSVEAGDADWVLPGVELEPVQLHNGSQKVELTLVAVQHRDRMELQLEYSSDLFDESTAERIAERIVGVLRQCSRHPAIEIGRLEVMARAERTLVLDEWNATAREFPAETLHALVERQVDRDPDATAVTDVDGGATSYRELDERANRLAHWLRAAGAGRESPVAVCLDHGVDLFVALLGVLKAGGAYVPLDPEHPAERLAYVLRDTGTRVIVTREGLVAALPVNVESSVLRVDADRARLAAQPSTRPEPVNRPGDLVYVIYTSGSTGLPKGVMITHLGLVNYLWWAASAYGTAGSSGAAMLGSPAFDLCIPNFWLPLITGKDVTLLPPDRSLESLARTLRAPHDFSLLKLTPGHLNVLRGLLPQDEEPRSVRTFVLGGDEVAPEAASAWLRIFPDSRFINEYGPTETVVGCSVYEVGDDFDPSAPVPIGRPIANTQMYVLDDELAPVPIGAVGELCVGGAGVARGYLGRPALTAEKFVPDPFGPEPGARMYRTGDLARFRADGDLEFLGRRDHQVKIQGYRVELGEVEARLSGHPEVAAAVVSARQDPPGRRALVAYIVAKPGSRLDAAALRAFAADALPEYMVPTAWVFLPELPLSEGGKVDRQRLPAPVPAKVESIARDAVPRGSREQRLARIWEDVLRVGAIGRDDDFFELGGDSILAIQVAARAKEAGLAMTPRRLFEHRTVASLAAASGSGASGSAARAADRTPATGDLPLTPIQHLMSGLGIDRDRYVMPVLIACEPAVDADVLDTALGALVEHHDALRTRLRRVDGLWQATVVEYEDSRLLDVLDVTGVGEPAAEAAFAQAVDKAIGGLSLEHGPLVRGVLVRSDTADRLYLAANHFAVDAVSWLILLDDLEACYGRLERGLRPDLPPKTSSFKAFSELLTAHANSAGFADEADSWSRAERRVRPLPTDFPDGANTNGSERILRSSLSQEETRALVTLVPAAYGTRIDDVLATALGSAVADWTGEHSIVLELERHGRHSLTDDLDVSRTVGWFSSLVPVSLRVSTGDWGARLRSVSAQLSAIPADGIGYGLARYLRREGEPWPERRPGLAINYLGRLDEQRTGHARMRRIPLPPLAHPDPDGTLPHLIEVDAAVVDGRLETAWSYSGNLFRDETVRRLSEAFLTELKGLIKHCRAVGATQHGRSASDALSPGAPLLLDSMARHGIPGAVFAMLRGGEVAEVWGEGVLRSGEPERVGPAAVFPLGSLSKHITAIAAMRLVERGALALDDDVNRWLTSWQVPAHASGQPVSLRHLLGHTSGLPEFKQLYLALQDPVPSLAEMLDGRAEASGGGIRPEFTPGSAYEYSNANFAVVEQLLVDVTGQSFPELVTELVLDPLGLRDTYADVGRVLERGCVVPTGRLADGTAVDATTARSVPAAAGGLWSTGGDLARIGLQLQLAASGRPSPLLSADCAEQMLRTPSFSSYGLGVTVHGSGGARWFSHGGEVPGYRCVLLAYTERDSGFAMMTNSAEGASLLYDILLATAG